MGIIKPGVLGETTGKVSNLIFYNVNGQLRVRKCPAKVRNPRSPKQTAQRTRVKGIADLYALLDDQIYYNWKALAEGTTANGYNLFMSHNIRNLNAEGKIADPAKLCLAQGGLYTPQWVNTEMTAEGKMAITWDTTEGEERTSYCDRLLIAVHTIRDTLELEEIMVVDETMVERSTGHYEWQVPEELAPAQAYGFFKGQYTNDVSGSFYLGELTKQGE